MFFPAYPAKENITALYMVESIKTQITIDERRNLAVLITDVTAPDHNGSHGTRSPRPFIYIP